MIGKEKGKKGREGTKSMRKRRGQVEYTVLLVQLF